MSKENNLQDFLTDVANAIREKKGTTEPINVQDFSAEIASIETGGGALPIVEKNDVTFFDYEGTILYSYTKDEFLALTEMPALPSREGLICQGWNWSYDDAIEYVSKYGVLDVGASYITDDGKTRLYIKIEADGRMDVPIRFIQTVSNGVVIDWGDGSGTQTISGTSYVTTTHIYSSVGDYCITLEVLEGCELSFGTTSSAYCVMGSTGDNYAVYCNMLKRVEVGERVTSLGNYSFYKCYSLSSISIPSNVTRIGNSACYYCYSLKHIVLPQQLTEVGSYVFYNCYSLYSTSTNKGLISMGTNIFDNCRSLQRVIIPEGITILPNYMMRYCTSMEYLIIPQGVETIGNNAFYGCASLSTVVVYDGLSSIGASAFYACTSVGYYDFTKLTKVPSLGDSSVFKSIYTGCKVYVPTELYSEWKSTTNWSSISTHLEKG